ncbi:MAG: protein kinase [Hyphomicrobiaceae bacterium]|nr:protein kinase [Hyphomicrobiaceae bacterium]
MTHVLALPAGTELVGDYLIERVLGAGGFGITYLAQELALARDVTIKEYFPGDFAARGASHDAVPRSQDCAGDYQWGLDRFIAEAQTLARFDHRNIVRVYRYFRANNTGYMVLQFEEGQSLKAWLGSLGRALRQHEIDRFLTPLLDALELIHRADYLHRDIAPDNIIIRRDGAPVLIDFGSARGDVARHSRTVSALVKPGYSPYEQYAETGSQQGPWTDIYALAATLYHAVTGKRPPDAPSRIVRDGIVPAREAALSSYRAGFLAAIDRALALDIEKRPQSIAEWRGALLAPEPRRPGWLQRTIGKAAGGDGPPRKSEPLAAPLGGAVPPPPDAPGAQGGLLEYIERLKKQSAPPDDPKPDPQPPPSQPEADPKSPAETLALPRTAALPRAEDPPAAAQRPSRKRLPRPRRVRAGGERGWWPLTLKLMVGAGVAAAAVGLQDELPGFEVRGAVTQTGAVAEIELARQLEGHAGGSMAVAFAADGRWIVTAGADGMLKIWDAATSSVMRSADLGGSKVTALSVLDRRALTGHEDGSVQLWDLARAERVGQFRRNQASVWSVAFMGEPTRFLSASHDWAVAVWDTRAGSAPVMDIAAHESAVQSVAYTSRGYLASGGADRLVKLWDASSGDAIRTYRGHRDFVSAVAFSPDGRLLASGSRDGHVRLWSTASHRVHRTLSRNAGQVGALAFSPAGDLLAAASADGKVRVWNIRRGRLMRSYGDGSAGFRSIAFAPDGRWLAAASDSGAVRLWETGGLLGAR